MGEVGCLCAAAEAFTLSLLSLRTSSITFLAGLLTVPGCSWWSLLFAVRCSRFLVGWAWCRHWKGQTLAQNVGPHHESRVAGLSPLVVRVRVFVSYVRFQRIVCVVALKNDTQIEALPFLASGCGLLECDLHSQLRLRAAAIALGSMLPVASIAMNESGVWPAPGDVNPSHLLSPLRATHVKGVYTTHGA